MQLNGSLRSRLILGAVALMFSAAPTLAREGAKLGYILNINSEKCYFKQAVETEKFFYTDLTARTGTLTFDNPFCMKATGVDGTVNTLMIAKYVAAPYSHDDAAFQTGIGELRPAADGQSVGLCIQSATYPIIGVAFLPIITNGYISGAKHSLTIQGCK